MGTLYFILFHQVSSFVFFWHRRRKTPTPKQANLHSGTMSEESIVEEYQAAVLQAYYDAVDEDGSDSYDDDFDDNPEEEVEIPSKDIRLWG